MAEHHKINYIELPGQDFDALEAFYSGAFGWSFMDYGPEYRSFSDGQVDGGFFQSQLRSTTENGSALVILYSSDLESSRAAVVTNSGQLTRDIFSFPGGRRFHFLDPHGNELAIWSDN